ncbi:LysR family transcriptional regulator substrate-binding protein [Arthrobacter psychrolactophilus]
MTWASATFRTGFPQVSRSLPLYNEQYVLLTAAGSVTTPETSWASVAELPLCLLAPQMQGRRRIDEIFQAAGLLVSPRLETDSVASLFAHVRTGAWSTIVPLAWLHTFELPSTLSAIPLVDPVHSVPVGVVTLAREPASIMAMALLAVARSTDLSVLETERERPAPRN